VVAVTCYDSGMDRRTRWVLLAYRLPREPSTPRITLWRQLRRLGVGQIADGVVALPLDARTRERFDWLAQEVIENGGDATVWLAEPGSVAQERALAAEMTATVAADYARVVDEAHGQLSESDAARRRTVARLRRELRRIGSRDYFPEPIAKRARVAVEELGDSLELAS
jgi:DNA-binding transcriptional regulator PaaX